MKVFKCILSILICISMLTACGDGFHKETEMTNKKTDSEDKVTFVENGGEIDYKKIAQAYMNQLKEDDNDAKATFHITKSEYGLNYNNYNDASPITTELIFKLEDVNNDGICELLEIVTAGQKERYLNMQDALDVIAVRAYTYVDDHTQLLYNNWDFYPDVTNSDLYAEYDADNNQFCVYAFYGGGGMFSESYTVLRENNSRVGIDYADIFYGFDPETNEENIEAKIYYDLDCLDSSDAYTILSDKYGDKIVSDEEKDTFLNQIDVHNSRFGGVQADDVYLDADKATEETIEGLLKRGTTSVYDDNKCRYYLQGIEFFHEDDGYYVSGLLSLEDAYTEKLDSWPSTHIVQEDVKYKVADGAVAFSTCGAYDSTIEEKFGDTQFPKGSGFVLVEDGKLYGLLYLGEPE